MDTPYYLVDAVAIWAPQMCHGREAMSLSGGYRCQGEPKACGRSNYCRRGRHQLTPRFTRKERPR